MQNKFNEDPPESLQSTVIPDSEMKINNKIMESIIRKYNPEYKDWLDDLHGRASEKERGDRDDIGLEKIAKHLSELSNGRLFNPNKVKAPQKKLYVMIMGNHSAGKSSFINWYIGDKLQQTKVSIQTVEINLIMHGSKKTELSGYNVMKLLPFMKELYDKKTKTEKFEGLLNNMSVKTSTSRVRNFE